MNSEQAGNIEGAESLAMAASRADHPTEQVDRVAQAIEAADYGYRTDESYRRMARAALDAATPPAPDPTKRFGLENPDYEALGERLEAINEAERRAWRGVWNDQGGGHICSADAYTDAECVGERDQP